MKRILFAATLLCLSLAMTGCVKNTGPDINQYTDPDERAIAMLLTARAQAASSGDGEALRALYSDVANEAPLPPTKPRSERVIRIKAISVIHGQAVAEYTELWRRGLDSMRVGFIAFAGKHDGSWKLHTTVPANEIIPSLR